MSPDDTFQANLRRRHKALMLELTAKPFNARHTDPDLEKELDWIECRRLDNPPYHKNEKGVWVPRKTGATEESQMLPGELPELEYMSFSEARLKVIPEREISDILNDPNYTSPDAYCPFGLDQDAVGSCGMEGSASGMMGRRVADGQEHVLVNPWAGYATTSGGRDNGSNPLDNLRYLQKYGLPSMGIWGRDKGWRRKPDNAAAEDALQYRISPDGLVRLENWAQLMTALLWFPCPVGYVGHWMCGARLFSTNRLGCKNSWDDPDLVTMSKNRVYWPYGAWAVIAASDRRAA